MTLLLGSVTTALQLYLQVLKPKDKAY